MTIHIRPTDDIFLSVVTRVFIVNWMICSGIKIHAFVKRSPYRLVVIGSATLYTAAPILRRVCNGECVSVCGCVWHCVCSSVYGWTVAKPAMQIAEPLPSPILIHADHVVRQWRRYASSVLQSRIQQWAWAPYCWSKGECTVLLDVFVLRSSQSQSGEFNFLQRRSCWTVHHLKPNKIFLQRIE